MNKSDLIDAVAAKTGLLKKDTEAIVNAAFDVIADTLASGDKVQLIGFGTFDVRSREARMGRNPQTQEPMEIKASKTASFKPGKPLKDKVAGQ